MSFPWMSRKSSTALLGLAFACGLAAAAVSQPGEAAPATPAAPAADPGKAVMTRACQTCHDLGMVTGARYTAQQWPAVVQRMRANGADLTDADAKLVGDYLAKTYAKGG